MDTLGIEEEMGFLILKTFKQKQKSIWGDKRLSHDMKHPSLTKYFEKKIWRIKRCSVFFVGNKCHYRDS